MQELQRRCETLIRLVEKENEDLDAREGGKAKAKAAGSKGGGGSSSKGDGASRCVPWGRARPAYAPVVLAGGRCALLEQDACGTACVSPGTVYVNILCV